MAKFTWEITKEELENLSEEDQQVYDKWAKEIADKLDEEIVESIIKDIKNEN